MAIQESQIQAALQFLHALNENRLDAERTTSASKSIVPVRIPSFEQAPALQPSLEKAKMAERPLEQRPALSKRTVSAAKEYYPDGLKGTRLENAPNVAQNFAGGVDNTVVEKTQGQAGSSQIRNHRPHPYPRPDLPGREAVDRAAFNAEWQAELKNAGLTMEAVEAAAERIKARRAQAMQQARGMDMGM